MKALRKLIFTEFLLFVRAPESVFFVPGLPLLLVIVFGTILNPAGTPEELRGPLLSYFPAMVLVLTLAIMSILIMPSTLAGYREKGILRRLATTPTRPAMVLVAQLVVSGGMALATLLLVTLVGHFAFDWSLPAHLGAVAVAFVLGVLALLALGLLVAAVSRTGNAATGIGLFVFFPSLFLSGVALPTEAMSPELARISQFTPLGATMQGLRDAWGGTFPEQGHLLALVLITVVCGAGAIKLFRWE
ncbi:ABC transporter permease [Microlunatus speluncae]|uniref:ABC transporter permease n=1 Tax=Microlunatus speluncae TaxID=2594267 RepID=UPI0012663677|nr:ABC transporter permease [Microlunatus speluncae]